MAVGSTCQEAGENTVGTEAFLIPGKGWQARNIAEKHY